MLQAVKKDALYRKYETFREAFDTLCSEDEGPWASPPHDFISDPQGELTRKINCWF